MCDVYVLVVEIMVNQLEIEQKDIHRDGRLSDMNIDSIALMTLVVYLEDKLSIEIDFDENWPIDITSLSLMEFVNNVERYMHNQER